MDDVLQAVSEIKLGGFKKLKLHGRRIIERGGRVFRLGYEKGRERVQKGIFLRYYIKPREDERSALGRRIDTFGFYFLLWLATFFLLSGSIGAFQPALLLSAPIFAMEVIGIRRLNTFLARQAGRYPEALSGRPPAEPGVDRPGFQKNMAMKLAAFRRAAFNSRKKVKNYFLIGFFMCAGHLFLRDSGLLSVLYLVFAVLNFGLGLACLFWGREEPGPEPVPGVLEPEEK